MKNSTKRDKKLGSKVKKPKKRSISLTDKIKKNSKVVDAKNLKWKTVDIPDNLGDYSGFYGLEEIDGVDVEVDGGNVRFVVRDDSSRQDHKGATSEEASDDGSLSTGSDEEFQGFDDNTDDHTSPAKEIRYRNENNDGSTKDNQNELSYAFSNVSSVDIPDFNDISLPEWESCNLNPFILSGLQTMGFSKPTLVQKKSIPLIVEGKDVIVKASTGSGKTLAFGIPILERYMQKLSSIEKDRQKTNRVPPTALIFSPTRELAHQVVDHLNSISKYAPLPKGSILNITGGLSIQKQERLLNYSPGVIVATPGRFLEHIEKDEEVLESLSLCDFLVLDEADRLLQEGHFEEIERILELLGRSRVKSKGGTVKRWQTLVFSATFSTDLFIKLDKRGKKVHSSKVSLANDEEVLRLLDKKLRFRDSHPSLVDINPKETISGLITEALIESGPNERDLYLYYFLLLYAGRTLVFANSIESVKRLVPFLKNLNISVFSIHSQMSQKQRLRSIEKFKQSSNHHELSVLIASDVAARGLDIPEIDHVVHYHLPKTADVYVHRSGRTGRAGKEGVSLIICSPQEASGPLKRLRKSITKPSTQLSKHDLKLLPIDGDILSQLRQRVSLASKIADSEISFSSTRKEESWVKQAADDLGLEDISDFDDFEDDVLKKQRRKKEKKMLTKEKAQMLKIELKDLLAKSIRLNHRRSYISGGLENLAHQIISGRTHEKILGQAHVTALDHIKTKDSKNKKKK